MRQMGKEKGEGNLELGKSLGIPILDICGSHWHVTEVPPFLDSPKKS